VRFGFFLGFLIGAAVASVLGKERHGPPPESVEEVAAEAERTAEGVVEGVRRQVREAIAAGKEAAAEKEAQVRLEYEETTRQQP
jgi:hypothetical protein